MNKTVIAQINTIAGDIENNLQKILNNISQAQKINANLIIFPKFALTGFPFGNILDRHKSLFRKQKQALEEIKSVADNITVVLAEIENGKENIIVIQNNAIYFDKENFEINSEIFGFKPDKKITTLICCDCKASRNGLEYVKNARLSKLAKDNNINCIYVNKIGYGDNFVFDGISRIYDKNGELTLRAKAFEEDFVTAQNNKGNIEPLPAGMEKEVNFNEFTLDYSNDLERTYKATVLAIKEYFAKNGFKKAVLGLSGGLDSTISAVLLADALGKENVFGISLPSKITSAESKNDAKILAENLGINFSEVPLPQAIDPMKDLLSKAFENIKSDMYETSTTLENLQARTRATILWSVANQYKQMLPIATSDKSEAYIGYATVNGDMSGGFAPLADITKTKLFALGHFLNEYRPQKNAIPLSILEKPPGAELKINPKTGKPVSAEEDNMPYEFLDEIIWLVENQNYGFDDLINHKFYSEIKNDISFEQKEERIKKFYRKMQFAIFKWHILPPSVIIDSHSINSVEYHHPILSKVY